MSMRSGIKDGKQLTVTTDPDNPLKYLIGEKQVPGLTAGPQGQSTSSDKQTYAVAGIIPSRCTWSQNGIRSADTASVDIKLDDCPFDPRAIRAVGIQLFMGTVSAADYEAGITGGVRTLPEDGSGMTSNEPLNLIPDTYVDPSGKQRTNLRFEGFVDDWEVEWEDDASPMVKLSARDNTQLFIDLEVPQKLVIAANLPIDKAIATYMANFPTFNGMSVLYLPTDVKVPVLSDVLHGTAFRPKLGPTPAKGGASGAGEKLSVWDYLTDVCGSIGHAIRIEGTTVVIQQVKTLLSSATNSRSDDPFQGRTLLDGTSFNSRRFIYGENVKSLSIKRAFSKSTPKNIEVRSWNPQRKNLLVVRFPENASERMAYALPGDANADHTWTEIRISGVKDRATLKLLAENVYQSQGRNELSAIVRTKRLTSFGGTSLDPDVLDMKAGDTFEVLMNRNDGTERPNTTTELEGQMLVDGVAKKRLRDLGYPGDLVDAYVKAYNDGNFQTTFKLKTLNVDWANSDDGGMSFTISGVNYLEVRVDESFREQVSE